MKRIRNYMMFCWVVFLGVHQSVADEVRDAFVLPERLEGLTQEALRIKQKAMAFPSMRLFEVNDMDAIIREGHLGREYQRTIDRIAEFPMDESLVESAEMHQYGDIRAKIIVWALDRSKRKHEYDRFAKYYVDSPGPLEAADYFSRVPLKEAARNRFIPKRKPEEYVPRPGTWRPDPVDEEDAIEENRLIMEYCYFSPPAGKRFDWDGFRGNLSSAIIRLGQPDKSIVVFLEDIKCIDRGAKWEGEAIDRNRYVSLYSIVHLCSEKSFKSLSALMGQVGPRDLISRIFQEKWSNWNKMTSDERVYDVAKKHYDTWMELANQPWETPDEKAFAEWLKKQPAPTEPPPPEYDDDPTSPFGPPPRPSE